jgi:hypothetical protein
MNSNFTQVLMPLAILVPIVGGFIWMARTLTGYFLRKRMVEKGYVDKESIAILSEEKAAEDKMNSLKWALVVFFGGLGLIILEYLDFGPQSPLPYGVFALSISLGLLIHFFILRRSEKQG